MADDLRIDQISNSIIDKATQEAVLDPDTYFMKIKDSVGIQTDESLNGLFDLSKNLLDDAVACGQTDLAKNLVTHLEAIRREKLAVRHGFDKFVMREHIAKYIEKVDKRVVKLIELKRYPRPIPPEVREKITLAQSLNLWDEFYVLFTDYTNKITKQVKQEDRKKDPIIFGVYRTQTYVVERFYFIADWVDEHCDLTLSVLLDEMKDLRIGDGQPTLTSDDKFSDAANKFMVTELAKRKLIKQREDAARESREIVELKEMEIKNPGFLQKIISLFK